MSLASPVSHPHHLTACSHKCRVLSDSGGHAKDFAKIIDRKTAVDKDLVNKHCLPSLGDSGIFNILALNILKNHYVFRVVCIVVW